MGRLNRSFLIEHGFHRAEVLIETGSNIGLSLARVADLYPEVHTIEIDKPTWEIARERLARLNHVRCHLGDSVEVLPRIIDTTKRTTLFLDSHFTHEGRTTSAPHVILRELEIILALPWTAPFVVLIDDAEKFGERFWRLTSNQHHNRDNWCRAEQVIAVINKFGYKHRSIGQRAGEVWVIEREWT